METFVKFTKRDSAERMVYGYVSTEVEDSQGDIVSKAAMREAWDDYWGNLREMHQSSAVGVVKVSRHDDKGTWIGGKIVDDPAWKKVEEEVYKGFSIGGRALERDPDDPRIITKLRLTEISLVDRGANAEARIELFKLDSEEMTVKDSEKKAEEKVEAPASAGVVLKLDTGDLDERLAKVEEAKESLAKAEGLLARADALIEKLGAIEKLEDVLTKVESVEKFALDLAEKVESGEKAGEELLKTITEAAEKFGAVEDRLETIEKAEAGVQPAAGARGVSKDEDSAAGAVAKVDESDPTELIKSIHSQGGYRLGENGF